MAMGAVAAFKPQDEIEGIDSLSLPSDVIREWSSWEIDGRHRTGTYLVRRFVLAQSAGTTPPSIRIVAPVM